MPGLTDMEEMLSRIQNKQIADYMREALGCYSAGAYRACVVLSYIAVFDDLRQKLEQLAAVSAAAKEIFREVQTRANDQQVFESRMIESLKSHSLISEGEGFGLEQIRVLRNKAAHPSGLHPSAEQARYVYFETVDKFLSQNVLKTTHAVDNILLRLRNDNFFPSQNVTDVTSITTMETSSIHHLAFPYLIIKLIESEGSPEAVLARNAALLLIGLAARAEAALDQELRARLLVTKAVDSSKSDGSHRNRI